MYKHKAKECSLLLRPDASILAPSHRIHRPYTSSGEHQLSNRLQRRTNHFAKLEWGALWDVSGNLSKASAPGYVLLPLRPGTLRFCNIAEGFRRSMDQFLLNLQVEWLIKAILWRSIITDTALHHQPYQQTQNFCVDRCRYLAVSVTPLAASL